MWADNGEWTAPWVRGALAGWLAVGLVSMPSCDMGKPARMSAGQEESRHPAGQFPRGTEDRPPGVRSPQAKEAACFPGDGSLALSEPGRIPERRCISAAPHRPGVAL